MTTLLLLLLVAGLLAWKKTRRFASYFLPWFLFGICYESMRFYPNYLVNDIDVRDLYEAEKSLFGISAQCASEIKTIADGTMTMTPGEYFSVHHCKLADFLAGIFYLCWVPVPIAFAIYLYIKKEYHWFSRFSWAFLIVNIVGFIGYYIHPAAPPWYIAEHGFDAILNTPGSTAGLGRWDELTGLNVFHSIYAKNANVFAAIPSLHAAYMLVTTIYAIWSRQSKVTVLVFALICMGIWWTAVYSSHHYVIDVLLGILTAFIGIGIYEGGRRMLSK